MKKVIKRIVAAALSAIIMLTACIGASADGIVSGYTVVDESAGSSSFGINAMNSHYMRLTKDYGFFVGAVITNDFHGNTRMDFVAEKIGMMSVEDEENALVILVMPETQQLEIYTFGFDIRRIFTSKVIDNIENELKSNDCFMGKSNADSAAYFAELIDEKMEDHKPLTSGEDSDSQSIISFVVAAIVPVVFGIFLASFFRKRIKKQHLNLEKPSLATFYDKQETVYYERIDKFIKEYTITTK